MCDSVLKDLMAKFFCCNRGEECINIIKVIIIYLYELEEMMNA